MTRDQVIEILDRSPKVINPLASPGTPTKVAGSVLMSDSTLFSGHVYAPSAHGTMQIDVERTHLAHLTKKPPVVFVDVRSVQAITSNSGTLPSAPAPLVEEAASRKDGVTSDHEEKRT